MDNIINPNQDILQQLSIEQANQQAVSENEENRNQFLELMIAQLENQNPLEPSEGGEFLSQLAQFSTVDGIEQLNTTMDDLASSFRSGQALEATSLIGRQVEVPAQYVSKIGPETISGSVDVAEATTSAKVAISNLAGEVVKTINMGNQSSGLARFTWDGLDDAGNPVPDGQYRLFATAKINGEDVQMDTQIGVNVDSVTIGTDGDVSVSLAGVGEMPLDELKRITE